VTSNARRGKRLGELLLQFGFVAALLGLWQWSSTAYPAPYLPPLDVVGSAYWSLLHGDLLTGQVAPSMYRLVVGFAIGVVLGAVVGLAIGYFRALDPWVRPVLEFLRAIPAAAVLPGAILLLGATDGMRISIIAFGCTFPVLLAAIDGARRVDELMLDTARISGLSRPATLRRVVVPAAVPQLFAGVRIALGLALIMMVISELIASNEGLGYHILMNQRLFRTADVYAGVLVIGTIGLLFNMAILQLEKRLLRWHRGWRGLPV
jgi:ABC-type nitrate/sulfonate/bicarbonate transport system permease component